MDVFYFLSTTFKRHCWQPERSLVKITCILFEHLEAGIFLKVVLSTITLTLHLFLTILFDFWCLTPLSAIFQLYHSDQFQCWKKLEYRERTTDHRKATGKLYHLRLRVECTLFYNLQTHAVLVIGLYELFGNPIILITCACLLKMSISFAHTIRYNVFLFIAGAI